MASKHKQEKCALGKEWGSQKVRPQSAGIRNRRLKQNRIRADKNRARPGTSTGTYRSNARIRQLIESCSKAESVGSIEFSSLISSRPETTEKVNIAGTLRRTGGLRTALGESKIINDAIKD